MTKSTKMLIAAAAMTGLLAGATAVKASTVSTKASKMTKATYGIKAIGLDDTDKHDCKGKNDCKGKGGCKGDTGTCKGKNDCKGKGNCKTADEKKADKLMVSKF